MVGLMRHRQTKGPDSARPYLNRRATPRLHLRTGSMSLTAIYRQSSRRTGGFAAELSILPVMTQGIEVRKPMPVTIEPSGKDPTCESTATFDMHPPISSAVLDDIDGATAEAKARSETAMALYRHFFVPLRKPNSLRPEDVVSVRFNTISQRYVPNLERQR